MRREFLTTETWTLDIYKYLLSKQSVRSPSHPGNRVYGFSPHPSILLTPNLMHCAADSQMGQRWAQASRRFLVTSWGYCYDLHYGGQLGKP